MGEVGGRFWSRSEQCSVCRKWKISFLFGCPYWCDRGGRELRWETFRTRRCTPKQTNPGRGGRRSKPNRIWVFTLRGSGPWKTTCRRPGTRRTPTYRKTTTCRTTKSKSSTTYTCPTRWCQTGRPSFSGNQSCDPFLELRVRFETRLTEWRCLLLFDTLRYLCSFGRELM